MRMNYFYGVQADQYIPMKMAKIKYIYCELFLPVKTAIKTVTCLSEIKYSYLTSAISLCYFFRNEDVFREVHLRFFIFRNRRALYGYRL